MTPPNFYSGNLKVSGGILKENVYLVPNTCNLPATFFKSFLLIFLPGTVEPRYCDTLQTRKKYRHKRSVAVTGVGETHVYKKLYFLKKKIKIILNFNFSYIFKQ